MTSPSAPDRSETLCPCHHLGSSIGVFQSGTLLRVVRTSFQRLRMTLVSEPSFFHIQTAFGPLLDSSYAQPVSCGCSIYSPSTPPLWACFSILSASRVPPDASLSLDTVKFQFTFSRVCKNEHGRAANAHDSHGRLTIWPTQFPP